MALQEPSGKKKTVTDSPRNTHKQPQEVDDDEVPPFYFLMMIPNIIGLVSKAYKQNQNPMMFFVFTALVGFLLLEFCLFKYLSLPRNKKSSQEVWLKFAMWSLYTALSVGIAYQFTPLLPFQMAVATYVVVVACSIFLLYAFIIRDLVEHWGRRRSCAEEEIGLVQNYTTKSEANMNNLELV